MNKKILLAVVLGAVIGAIWLIGLRFFTYKSDAVHYHANFELYINGQQDKFDNFTFYEEVESCDSDALNNPKTRVHLHGHKGSVVHVHDNAVTWGHLMANLGYGLTDLSVKNDDGVFVAGNGGSSLSFRLNGKDVASVANRVIGSEDVLLINYGNETEDVLHERYDAIPKDAGEYNNKNDPAACAGTKPDTFWNKLKLSAGLGG